LAGNEGFYIETRYERRVFETEATIVSKAPPEIILEIAEHLRQMEIDALEWATRGLLAGDDESRNLLQVEYRGGEYDQYTGVFDFFVDIHFLRRVFENIRISVIMKTGEDLYGNPFIEVELTEP
jgi:phosphatidylserine decarboxylase